jgi:Lipocalin-like domain
MTYQPTRLVALTLSCWSAAILTHAQAQTAQDMVGSWALVANVNIREDGTRVDVYGANPKGIQIFESGGRFALITTRSDLPRFASNNRITGTPEENAAIVRGSNAFFGTYTVQDKVLTHKIEGGTWPAWNGTEQRRQILSFSGDEMKWAISGTVGGRSEVTWRRLK